MGWFPLNFLMQWGKNHRKTETPCLVIKQDDSRKHLLLVVSTISVSRCLDMMGRKSWVKTVRAPCTGHLPQVFWVVLGMSFSVSVPLGSLVPCALWNVVVKTPLFQRYSGYYQQSHTAAVAVTKLGWLCRQVWCEGKAVCSKYALSMYLCYMDNIYVG